MSAAPHYMVYGGRILYIHPGARVNGVIEQVPFVRVIS